MPVPQYLAPHQLYRCDVASDHGLNARGWLYLLIRSQPCSRTQRRRRREFQLSPWTFWFLVTGENGYGGLNGFHDQMNALKWVQQHIESFGGNPNDVTIFGESAGAFGVCMLCVSPLAKGLFHRSISQSGDCALGSVQPNDAQGGAQITAAILNMTSASSAAELSNAALFPAQELASFSTASLIGWPTVDGWVLPDKPSQLYGSADNVVPKDMIIGSTSYDDPSILRLLPSKTTSPGGPVTSPPVQDTSSPGGPTERKAKMAILWLVISEILRETVQL